MLLVTTVEEDIDQISSQYRNDTGFVAVSQAAVIVAYFLCYDTPYCCQLTSCSPDPQGYCGLYYKSVAQCLNQSWDSWTSEWISHLCTRPHTHAKVTLLLKSWKNYPVYLGFTKCHSISIFELTETLDKELCCPKERQLELSKSRTQSLGGGQGSVGTRDCCLWGGLPLSSPFL